MPVGQADWLSRKKITMTKDQRRIRRENSRKKDRRRTFTKVSHTGLVYKRPAPGTISNLVRKED